MTRNLFVLAAIIGCALTDDHGHHDHGHHDHDSAAPATSFGAPAPSYEALAPAYEASAPSYEAPAPSYEAPAPAYEAPVPSYGAPANPQPSYIAPANPAPAYAAPANPTPTYEAPTASAPSYAAPAVSYGAPSSEYGAPGAEYGAPAEAYGAPFYGAPQQYNEGYAAEADSGFDLSNITSFLTLPFFLAAFAAIIVAQLFAPILGTLSSLDVASAILAPLHSAKLGLVNAVLSPFNLVLGNVGSCTPATGRSLDAGWNMSPDDVLNLMFKANEIYNDFSS